MIRTVKTLSVFSGLALLAVPAWAQTPQPTTRPALSLSPTTRPTTTRPMMPPSMMLPPATRPAPDELAFTLNGKKYTEGDVEKTFKLYTAGQKMDETQAARFLQSAHQKVIDTMIEDQLIQSEADKLKVNVTDADVDAGADKWKKRVMSEQSMTPEQFTEQVQKVSGMTPEEFLKARRPFFRKQVLTERIGKELFKDAEATNEEVQQQYEKNPNYAAKVRASHILIKPEGETPDAKETARKKAEEVLAKVKKPDADFAALAKEYSACPSKAQGGDLNYFPRKGAMVEPFAAAAFALKTGQTSDLVETNFGYHIIKVTDSRPAKELSEVRDEIRENLSANKLQMKLAEHLKDLKAKADVKYPPGKEPPAAPKFDPSMMRQPPTTGPAGTRPAIAPTGRPPVSARP